MDHHRSPARLAAVLTVALGLALTACGSTSGQSASGGDTINISMAADINAPASGFSFKEAADGANAAVAAINKAGGIHGAKLVLTICDGKGEAQTEQDCGRQIAQSDSVATVGDSLFITSIEPLLQRAGMAEVLNNPAQPSLLAAPNSFPVSGSAFLGSLAEINIAKDLIKATKVSLIAVGPAASTLDQLVGQYASQHGVQISNVVTLQGNETDLTPAVQKANSNGAQAVALLAPPDNSARLIQAMRQNGVTIPPVTIALTNDQIASLGNAANGTYELDYFPPQTSTEIPGIAQFQKEMDANNKNAAKDTTSLLPWFAVHAFAQVAAGLPHVTRSSVLAAWNKLTTLNTLGLVGS
jgi:branched-chain amino acid transport system substrate-binding protein